MKTIKIISTSILTIFILLLNADIAFAQVIVIDLNSGRSEEDQIKVPAPENIKTQNGKFKLRARSDIVLADDLTGIRGGKIQIIKEVPIEVVKEIQVIKEIPVEVIKEINMTKQGSKRKGKESFPGSEKTNNKSVHIGMYDTI